MVETTEICPILGRVTAIEPTPFRRDQWQLVQCRETGFVYLANPPSYDALESDLAWEKTVAAEKARRSEEEPIFSRVSTAAKVAKNTLFPKRNKVASLAFRELNALNALAQADKPLKLLDVGCGGGENLLSLYHHCQRASIGLIPIGIEVSRKLARLAQERTDQCHGQVVCANAVEGVHQLDSESIHVVLMSSFLEHECQPLELLKGVRRVLTEDGSVIIKVPNFESWNRKIRGARWCGFRFPDHVNYFTPATLERLAAEAGFTMIQQSTHKFPLSDNMYAILRKSARN